MIKVDFMNFHKKAFVFSAFLIIASILLLTFKGINKSIDFSGGIVIELDSKNQTVEQIRSELKTKNIGAFSVQRIDDHIMIKIGLKDGDSIQKNDEIKSKILSIEGVKLLKSDFVSPQFSSELIVQALIAVGLSFLIILLYLSLRFELQYGIGAIIAILHDVIITMGFISIIGLDFNMSSIAAILTVIGYSVNDSVVIYDRIRERLSNSKVKRRTKTLHDLISKGISSTMSRTVLTSSTTILALIAIILFGGSSTFSFSMIACFGVVIGTFSSIFIAAPILYYIKSNVNSDTA